MAYDPTYNPLIRNEIIGYTGDAGTRPDSACYSWNYVTTDTAAVVEGLFYFDACTELARGDTVTAVMNRGVGATPVFKQYVVVTGKRSGDLHNALALQSGTLG